MGDMGNTFYCRVGDLGNDPPLQNPQTRTAAQNALSQSRVNGAWESFNALRLGGTVEALLCCDETDSARSIHALLDTASDHDELD